MPSSGEDGTTATEYQLCPDARIYAEILLSFLLKQGCFLRSCNLLQALLQVVPPDENNNRSESEFVDCTRLH